MELLLGAIVVIFVVYFMLDKLVLKKNNEEEINIKVKKNCTLPYKVTDNFLTNAERSFYHALKLYLGNKAVICPKVGLKDIFFIGKGVGKDYMKYFSKISKKHVDFLLCEPETMKPLCGIELDDISHTSKKSYERDLFIKKVYKDANFELIRFSQKSGYSQAEFEAALSTIIISQEVPLTHNNDNLVTTAICPKCNIPMVLRKSSKGQNAGKEFYGCRNYPNCKEIINI